MDQKGKYRPGYDISFECKYSGMLEPGHLDEVVVPKKKKKEKGDGDSDDDDEVDKERKKRECRGTLKMHDITSEDDPEDWEYEVTIKKYVECPSKELSARIGVHALSLFRFCETHEISPSFCDLECSLNSLRTHFSVHSECTILIVFVIGFWLDLFPECARNIRFPLGFDCIFSCSFVF